MGLFYVMKKKITSKLCSGVKKVFFLLQILFFVTCFRLSQILISDKYTKIITKCAVWRAHATASQSSLGRDFD